MKQSEMIVGRNTAIIEEDQNPILQFPANDLLASADTSGAEIDPDKWVKALDLGYDSD